MLQKAGKVGSGSVTSCICAPEFDGDGIADLAVANSGSDNISCLYNTTTTVACCLGIRGDVNGDGDDANILDLTFLVDFIFRGSLDPGPCPEESDVNVDGEVANILDLTYLVDVIVGGGPVPPGC